MNKAVNYFKINRGKPKITYFIIFSVVIYNLINYISFLQNTKVYYANWYDLIISIFSSYMNIAYFYFTIFLLFIYNITSKSNFYKYIFFRLGSKKKWYFYNISNVIISSILFTALIVVQTILEGAITLSFSNSWSEYSIHLTNPERKEYLYSPETFSYVINNMKPLKYIMISIFLILLFFCTVGLLYLIFSMIFKNKIIALFGVLVINFMNIYAYNFEVSGLITKSFYYNTAVVTVDHKVLDNSMFYDRFSYWIVLILGLIVIGNVVKSHISFEYGDEG